MFKWIVFVSGAAVLLFNIFVYTGGKAKFKSDLPKPEKRKGKGDRVS